jgi:putative endonuclease
MMVIPGASRRAATPPPNSRITLFARESRIASSDEPAQAGSVPIDRQQLGLAAEERAALQLQQTGYQILLRNFRCRLGELDIVARRGELLIVVEVRLRSRQDFGGAGASITSAKRRRIIRATRYLLVRRPALSRLQIRFDTLLLNSQDGTIDWIEDAFSQAPA